MVTWYDYTTHKAICLPAVGEVALCTLYWGDDEYPDVSVKVAGEWKGDAVVGISELNPNFDFLDAKFGSVVRIGIDSLRPIGASSIITQWRPFSICPFGVRVAFKKHGGAIFSGDRRGDGRAWSELNNNPTDINPPFWQPIDDTFRNVIINNRTQEELVDEIIDMVKSEMSEAVTMLEQPVTTLVTPESLWSDILERLNNVKEFYHG